MKKILDIIYYSQYENVKDEYWKPRACSIVCLKMVLDYHLGVQPPSDSPAIEDLIKEGIYIKGLDENKDWIQDKIIMLARNHGVRAYRQEFKSFDIDLVKNEESESKYSNRILDEGINKIITKLSMNNPVMVSVAKKFKEEKKFHMVVLTGFDVDNGGEVKGFYYNDTDYQNEQEGKNLFVDIGTFKKFWRRLSIFVNNSKIGAI
ncbi:C39 family peptidase [Patescibacteria group bacterium]